LLKFIGPMIARMFGYIPGWLGLGTDFPNGVFLEWASWCLKPNYLFDDETLDTRGNFKRFTGTLRGIGMTDDSWAPPVALEKLLSHYVNAKREHITISPHEVGVKKLGHFGFFRELGRDKLWPEAAEWLSR
jgi:predicted alpha/beta hydrolase